jgi:hypothetical protein
LGEDLRVVAPGGSSARSRFARRAALGVLGLALALVVVGMWALGGRPSARYDECATQGFPAFLDTTVMGPDKRSVPGQVRASDGTVYWWVLNGQHGNAYYRGGRCGTTP